ncbi:MAG: IgGFc-binding protein [Myxococcota bacterium]|nr:IgGFc-binding protein [Myxococcota bacterium]MDW8361349.1 IgGFc-binding protein [Myxococcales bacterium]
MNRSHSFARARVVLATLLVLTGCSGGRRGSGSGGNGARDAGAGTGDGGACTSGTRCMGAVFERCLRGFWVPEQTCGAGQLCDPSAGCVTADACTAARLERSHVGCEYFAVDLPQPRVSSWPIVLGYPWRAQFGVVISNPNPEACVVRIERNDAAPGSGEAIAVVAERMVAGNSVEVFPLPPREVSGLASDTGPPSRSTLTNLAYRITSTLPVVAYQFNPMANEGVYSDDASLLVPVHSLDESYVAIGWPGVGNASGGAVPVDNRSFLTIVATQPGTRVRVVPSTAVQPGDGVPALAAGEPIEVLLDRFGVLNLQGADLSVAGETDFTGSRIEADRPVAVFSGVEATAIPLPGQSHCCADHLEEQLIPRSSLGTEYAVVRSRPRRPSRVGPPEPDFFKILAIVDGTVIETSLGGADGSFRLDRGQARLILADRSFTLRATEPVVVAQFLISGESVYPDVIDPGTGEIIEEGDQIGDPSFITVPPVAQFRSAYRFLVPSGYERDYALVAAPAGTELRLDGRPLSCQRHDLGEIAATRFEGLHCELPDGAHSLEADVPFGLVIEGWGPGVVSYGYTGGMDFEPINTDCVEDADCPGGEFCSGGVCVPEIDLI